MSREVRLGGICESKVSVKALHQSHKHGLAVSTASNENMGFFSIRLVEMVEHGFLEKPRFSNCLIKDVEEFVNRLVVVGLDFMRPVFGIGFKATLLDGRGLQVLQVDIAIAAIGVLEKHHIAPSEAIDNGEVSLEIGLKEVHGLACIAAVRVHVVAQEVERIAQGVQRIALAHVDDIAAEQDELRTHQCRDLGLHVIRIWCFWI